MAYARHSSNNRRGRNNRGNNRNNNRRSNQPRPNQVYDSNGPEGRVRGTAAQIVEKYTSLARDANASGNKVLQQSFLQHAEHYQRIANDVQKQIAEANAKRAEQKAHQKEDNVLDQDGTEQADVKASGQSDDKMTDVPSFLSEEKTETPQEKTKKKPTKAKKIKIEEKVPEAETA